MLAPRDTRLFISLYSRYTTVYIPPVYTTVYIPLSEIHDR